MDDARIVVHAHTRGKDVYTGKCGQMYTHTLTHGQTGRPADRQTDTDTGMHARTHTHTHTHLSLIHI